MVEIGKLYHWRFYDADGERISIIVCPLRDVYVQGKFLGYFAYVLDDPDNQIYISPKGCHELREVNGITSAHW